MNAPCVGCLAMVLLFCVAVSAAPITEDDTNLPPEGTTDPQPSAGNPLDLSGGQPLPVPSGAQQFIDAAFEAFKNGDVDGCREQLLTAFAKFPELPPPNLVLANLFLSSGNIPAGRQLLEEVAKHNPNTPDVYLLFGKLALLDGRATDALLQFERAESLEVPDGWTEDKQNGFKLSVLLGKVGVAENRAQWGKAAELLGEAANTDRQNGRLRDRWATALFLAGELQRAHEQFDIAHRQDETINLPEISMAVMHTQRGEFPLAEQWFAKALAKYPDDPAVNLEYSVNLLIQDRAEDAKSRADRAAEAGLSRLELALHRGMIARQLKDHDAAAHHFADALKQSPDNFDATNQLALVLIEHEDESKQQYALRLARHNALKYAGHLPAQSTLGWIYFRLGQVDQAEHLLRLAASVRHTSHLETTYYLGRVLQQQNRPEEVQAIARQLQAGLSQPTLFVLRPEVRQWIATVLDK